MSTLTTRNGITLYYKDWGRGRPVVLLHGWPLSSDTFDDMGVAIASAGMRAIAYDRRGFGRSDQPWDGYDYDSLTDDLADVIAATGADDAAIVGFSMGGGEVARYMSRYGGAHLSQAALLGSVVPYLLKDATNPEGVDGDVFDQIARAIRTDRAAFWAGFFPNFYGGEDAAHEVSSQVADWSRTLAMQASLRATLCCAESFATTDFRPDLGAFKVPTLIIHGTADRIVPIAVSSRKATEGIAGSTFIEYAGAPHGLLASHKDRVIDDVLAFLKRSA
jgi:pimeloyl-ACP methyl ester carboxylesterase